MNLLNDHQINASATNDLYDTLNAIRRRLCALEEHDLLNAATTWRTEHNITNVTRVTIYTSEWDNGIFYSSTPWFSDDTGAEITLSDEISKALDDQLVATLTELSDFHGPLGEHSTLTVDLTARTLTTT